LAVSNSLVLVKKSAESEEVQDMALASALYGRLVETSGGLTTIYNNTFGDRNRGFQSGHVSGGTFSFGSFGDI
jgi:hypothetical protein